MKKTKLLYLGNVLSAHGSTPTTIETLSVRLSLDFEVIISSDKKNKLYRLLHMWWMIFELRNSLTYVMIDTYSSSAYIFAWTSAAICRLLKLPYIAYLHGGSLPERFDADVERSKKYIENAHAVVCPSGYLQFETVKRFQAKPVIIPNYIDVHNYPFKLRESSETLSILWVRSFHSSYNPEMAIYMLNILNSKGIETRLTMVGPDKDGSMENCKKLAATLGVSDKLTVTGRLPKADWIALSANYNIFLNTTTVDNTPVSVMEAMALGMPVITTKVGGIPYLFTDGLEGIMVEEQTPEAMCAAIEILRNQPEKTAAISAAARTKAESWDWEIVRLIWLELFDTK